MIIPPEYLTIVIKLLLATGLGMVIGAEREIHKKPAGLRTHSLVALGACLFTLIGLSLVGSTSDSMSRVIQGTIVGIGFIGAGIIFQSRSTARVGGFTTAAEIWTLAAIGILVGLGSYFIAIVSTALILIILVPFKWVKKEIRK